MTSNRTKQWKPETKQRSMSGGATTAFNYEWDSLLAD